MPQLIAEATPTVATPVADAPGRYLIQLISPGWGSSGYYAADVLEAAGKAGVWPSGTHMYLDHPTRTEEYDRPERSVRDLAAVLAEDARWDDGLQALVAEAKVFGTYREALDDMSDDIGVSIRAYAESKPGEAEGRHGQIVTALVEGISVDFVTHAGRGGKVLQVLESARTRIEEQRGSGSQDRAAEATANDIRQALNTALVDAYGGEQTWVGVRDFDPDNGWVVFYQCTPDSDELYQIDYSTDGDGNVALDGDPVEVRAVTTYVPVDPAGQSPSTESKEDTMPEIDATRLRELEEASGRVTTLESERDAAVQRAETAESERDQARNALAERDRSDVVARILGEATDAASVDLDEYQAAGIASHAVNAEDGTLDEAATRTAFDAAIAKLAERQGHGRPRGLGGKVHESTQQSEVTEADLDELDAAVFGGTTQEV